VPNLILQPLIENAVRHGISRRINGGRLRITANRRENGLSIRVSNSHPDIDDPNKADSPPGSGLGLDNTRARLASMFGPDYSLEITRGDETTSVTVFLPLQ